MHPPHDIAIIGGGISGFSTALRLQKKGFQTVVFESHGKLGGCAGFFSKKEFAFDAGATTLVDFIDGGVGGNFFKEIGLPLPKGEYLDYIAWLPDRQITLYRDPEKWKKERLEKLGSSPNHLKFWALMDKVTDVFWNASRNNLKLPIQHPADLFRAIQKIGLKNIYLVKYLNYKMLDVLKKFQLENDKPLKGLLAMLIEDTVHSSLEEAPFINAALGTTIRGAGLMRAEGGMKNFWTYLSEYYLQIGGTVHKRAKVLGFEKEGGLWKISTANEVFFAKKIISSLPIDLTAAIAPPPIKTKLEAYFKKNEKHQGAAFIVFLGVPESEISNQAITHHQLLQDYDAPLGNGNNMFISISAKDDILSAPIGHRSVMISTHCNMLDWQNLTPEAYQIKKKETGDHLIFLAKKVYPNLATNPVVYEIGTPLTYQRYTQRTKGAVGGFKQTLQNSNLKAIPQDIGEKDFWLVGDNTWPGLGTVAGLIGSQIVANYVAK